MPWNVWARRRMHKRWVQMASEQCEQLMQHRHEGAVIMSTAGTTCLALSALRFYLLLFPTYLFFTGKSGYYVKNSYVLLA